MEKSAKVFAAHNLPSSLVCSTSSLAASSIIPWDTNVSTSCFGAAPFFMLQWILADSYFVCIQVSHSGGTRCSIESYSSLKVTYRYTHGKQYDPVAVLVVTHELIHAEDKISANDSFRCQHRLDAFPGDKSALHPVHIEFLELGHHVHLAKTLQRPHCSELLSFVMPIIPLPTILCSCGRN
ncbi:MAG: hypothetical protein P4M11_01170 [Candidatus Pacebacteria bacterium]|nr:hypothetical protein [Candidatus Paceibacterota bacterium]